MGFNISGIVINKDGKEKEKLLSSIFNADLELIENRENGDFLNRPREEKTIFVIECNDYLIINTDEMMLFNDDIHYYPHLSENNKDGFLFDFSETAMVFGFDFTNMIFNEKTYNELVLYNFNSEDEFVTGPDVFNAKNKPTDIIWDGYVPLVVKLTGKSYEEIEKLETIIYKLKSIKEKEIIIQKEEKPRRPANEFTKLNNGELIKHYIKTYVSSINNDHKQYPDPKTFPECKKIINELNSRGLIQPIFDPELYKIKKKYNTILQTKINALVASYKTFPDYSIYLTIEMLYKEQNHRYKIQSEYNDYSQNMSKFKLIVLVIVLVGLGLYFLIQ